jgi:hypothetical protein
MTWFHQTSKNKTLNRFAICRLIPVHLCVCYGTKGKNQPLTRNCDQQSEQACARARAYGNFNAQSIIIQNVDGSV